MRSGTLLRQFLRVFLPNLSLDFKVGRRSVSTVEIPTLFDLKFEIYFLSLGFAFH